MRGKTKLEFIEQLSKEKPNLMLIGEYYGMSKETSFLCLDCGYAWNTQPKNLVYGRSVVGCRECAKLVTSHKISNSHDFFVSKLSKVNPSIQVVGTYVGIKTDIGVKCLICGNEWESRPDFLLRGGGCKVCYLKRMSEEMKLDHDYFVEKCNKAGADVTFIGKYNGQNKHITVRCNKCGHIYDAHPSSLAHGHGCALCSSSRGERKIQLFLDENSIEYISQYKFDDCRYKYRLPFDFYLPEYNMCIEFDGRQHFEPVEYFGGECGFEQTKIRDNIKNKFCNESNISLIRIPYYDFDNIETILSSYIFK